MLVREESRGPGGVPVMVGVEIEVGWVRLVGGWAGDYLLALDEDSMMEAYAAHPGVPLYRPREIAALERVKDNRALVETLAAIKRDTTKPEPGSWGAIIDTPDPSKLSPRCVEELRAAIDAGEAPVE